MGESSQIEKMLKKLERTLDKCEVEHVFRGTILEFDKVDPVPKDRLIKGMLVDEKRGIRHVNLSNSETGTSATITSSLNVGDTVVILGTQHSQRETATLPMLIMHPAKQTLLFAQEPEGHQWSRGDTVQTILYVILQLISVIFVFIIVFTFIIPLFPMFSVFWWVPLVIATFVMLLLFLGVDQYHRCVRRARVVRFDSQGWKYVVEAINDRFNLEI